MLKQLIEQFGAQLSILQDTFTKIKNYVEKNPNAAATDSTDDDADLDGDPGDDRPPHKPPNP